MILMILLRGQRERSQVFGQLRKSGVKWTKLGEGIDLGGRLIIAIAHPTGREQRQRITPAFRVLIL
jgi:hypothetical protein